MGGRLSRNARTLLVALTVVPLIVGALGGCGGEQTTGGRYLAVDDTGLRPHPIERGWMIALPAGADATRDVLGVPFGGDWSYHNVEIDEADVLAAGGVWQPVGPGGRFDLPVAPGEWIVCSVGDGGGAGPYRVGGCSEATIADGDRLLATVGEGGFWVEHD